MDLDFSDEQRALREALHDFCEKESSPAVVRAAEPLGFDPSLWRKVADLGLPAVAVPEHLGGGGSGFVELAIAAELFGQFVTPVPLIEAATAARLLAPYLAPEVRERVLAGEQLATLALHPVTGAAGTDGVARLVPAGAVADLVAVLRGDELVLVEQPDKPAAAVPNLGAMPLADCAVPADATVLARGPEAVAAHGAALDHWRLLTGAALVGVADRALHLGREYVLQRRAFGVLIGNFQTIQHRLADNATALNGARILARKAAWTTDEGLPRAAELAAMSFLFAAETAFRTASDSLHFHGGYGFTLEYDIQLYFRRAKAWPLVAGDPRAAYADLARRLYGAGPDNDGSDNDGREG